MKDIQGAAETMSVEEQRRKLPLFAFYIANVVSFVGSYLSLLAIPWFVLQTTGSVTETGITAFFSTLPTVVSAFFGSVVVDRLGYKRMSVMSDIASGVSVALVPLLYHTVGLSFWQLQALVFLGGLLKAPGGIARTSLVPDLATLAKTPLERANAISDGVGRVAGFFGGPIAGILIVLIGSSNLLWIDGASFIFSALLIGFAVPTTARAKAEKKQNFLENLLEGVRFIRRDAFIMAIVITIVVTNLLDGALFSVVEPDYVKQVFGSAVPLGLLVAGFGGAAFVSTFIFGAIGHRLPRRLTFTISFIVMGALVYGVLILKLPLPLIIAGNILAGLAVGPINPLIFTVVQERTPAEMRARVVGAITSCGFIGIPLGTVASGYLIALLGLKLTLTIMGGCYMLATCSLLFNSGLREM